MNRSAFPGMVVSLLALPTAATAPAAQLYELTTEIGMPHLEENLRYTLQHTRECLTNRMLTTVFPILEHPALHGCRPGEESRDGTTTTYQLVCDGGHGTKGEAVWKFESPVIRGVLHITLGGKNMTFYQKVTAVRLGSCDLKPDARM